MRYFKFSPERINPNCLERYMKVKILKIVRGREEALASGIAALLIIVGGVLVLNYFSGQSKVKSPSITPEATQTANLAPAAPQPGNLGNGSVSLPTTYTVVAGDNLYSIAKKFYGDGNQWTVISKANNLANPSIIHRGNVFAIPQISAPAPTSTAASGTPPAPASVSGGSVNPGSNYTVVSGDTLWTIAIRAYGSGYQWYRIDTANSPIPRNFLNHPLIFPNQVLRIP